MSKGIMLAVDEFCKEHTEMAQSVIKSHVRKLKLDKQSQVELRAISNTPLAYFDGHKYKTVEVLAGDVFTLGGMYVGKSGFVIFTLSSEKWCKDSSERRLDIKLTAAFTLFTTFDSLIYNILKVHIEQRVELKNKEEYEKEVKEKEAQWAEKQAVIEAKVAKYKGKVNYGTW